MSQRAVDKTVQNSKEELLNKYCRTRDIELRNELVSHYLYIAEIIAKKFANRGIEYDDLFQVASLALIKALERYDITKGYKFSSYATPTIIGEIKNYFRDKSRMIRLPRKENEMIKKIEGAKSELHNQLGHPPNSEEIAGYLNISAEQVLELMESSYFTNTASLDYYIDDEEETHLMAVVGKEEKSYSVVEDRDFINRMLEGLNEIEKKVIYERFYNERSQRDIADEMGVSQMYISRMERKLLERFRAYFKRSIQ